MKKIIVCALFLICCVTQSTVLFAHCDTRSGPVVKAAAEALKTNNVKLVLIWVRQEDEPEVRSAFARAVSVRKASKDARVLADDYFFETVVRLHRAGEGESYTGLKDTAPEPAVLSAERALERSSVDSLLHELNTRLQQRLSQHFNAVLQTASYDPEDVPAGREYVASYISFLHYVEALYAASSREMIPHSEHEARQEPVKKVGADPHLFSITRAAEGPFFLLLIAAFILLGLLMIIVLILNKKLSFKYSVHKLSNGTASYLIP